MAVGEWADIAARVDPDPELLRYGLGGSSSLRYDSSIGERMSVTEKGVVCGRCLGLRDIARSAPLSSGSRASCSVRPPSSAKLAAEELEELAASPADMHSGHCTHARGASARVRGTLHSAGRAGPWGLGSAQAPPHLYTRSPPCLFSSRIIPLPYYGIILGLQILPPLQ